MSRHFSLIISRVCIAAIFFIPLAALWLLFDIQLFAGLIQKEFPSPIIWSTVETWQYYVQWGLTLLYLSIGLFGIYYLHRAFINISKGEWFNQANSANLRRFSILLLVQAIATPFHFMFSSVLLSLNHPAGEKTLSIMLGSGEIKTIILAMILWVLSDLLVASAKLQSENRQFV